MRILVAIPCMEMVHSLFAKSLLGMRRVDGELQFGFSSCSLVYDSRNGLTKKAISEGFDYVLWLDSDMDFPPDILEKLIEDAKEGRNYISALYVKRKLPVMPIVYKELGYYQSDEGVTPVAIPYLDYPEDSIFEIEGSGFGGCLTSVELLKKVAEKHGAPFSPILGFGEDLSFCFRVKDVGEKMYCDSRVKLGHIGYKIFTEEDYDRGESDADKGKDCYAHNY